MKITQKNAEKTSRKYGNSEKHKMIASRKENEIK